MSPDVFPVTGELRRRTFQVSPGEYDPPTWDDRNYAAGHETAQDPKKKGFDGIQGTATVASSKPHAPIFNNLGGNVMEWTADLRPDQKGPRFLRGGAKINWNVGCTSSLKETKPETFSDNSIGFRLERKAGL